MDKFDKIKAVRVLKSILREIERIYIPKPDDQDRMTALRMAIAALEQ